MPDFTVIRLLIVFSIIVAPLLVHTRLVSAQGSPMLTSSCCNLATGSCRSSCEDISLVALATNDDDRWRYLNKLTTFCSQQLVPFWSCLNQTLYEIDKGQGFFGRPCCTLPQSQACTLVCLQAKTKEDLMQACRPSDEITFYTCLDRQKAGQKCCKEAGKSECSAACKELFSSSTIPSTHMRNYVTSACSQEGEHVIQCVQNYTLMTPADNPTRNLHCCDKSSDLECRIACRNILKTQTIGQEIVENLIAAGCGAPMPHDKLWQCFLTNADSMKPEVKAVSELDNLGMDIAKLQCCFRAATLACQRLCIKTFTNEWEKTWVEFDLQCQYQLAESAMLQCLAEVEEPCELGCEGLTYCTNFNYRPAELFRNCDSRTDQAARHDVELWHRGIIRMPMVDIPVLDIATCFPNTWKTIACALQIKPCHNQAHVNMICKSDCIKILSQCVDKSRLQDGQTPSTLCEVLSPPGSNPTCISLSSYLEESKYAQTPADVTHPCKPSICQLNEVCLVNRTCRFGEACFPHMCKPGCRMGAMSHLVVPGNTYAQVPRIYHGKHCHMICYCNKLGDLENCVAMPCLSKSRCMMQGKEIAHKSQYYRNCTVCFCYAGELRCAKICNENDLQNTDHFSGPVCNCPDHYVPVCGANGKTYPSACLARCAGLKDGQFESGVCSENNPCKNNPCGSDKCLVRRRVCLSVKRKCAQHICVNTEDNCDRKPQFPVCDKKNEEHPNPCYMLQKERQLSYYGKCMSHCQRWGNVCGHNGQTYSSECAAWADRMSIDYRDSCVANPLSLQNVMGSSCLGVRCQPLPSEHCTGITPPGSCCPICGAALKLVYSQKLLDRALDAIQTIEPAVTLRLTEKLQEHVKTAECDLSAYLSVESTIIVIILPNTARPSALQVKACTRETEKLQALVEQGSPTLLTELPLSALIGGFLVQPLTTITNRDNFSTPSLELIVLFLFIVHVLNQRNLMHITIF